MTTASSLTLQRLRALAHTLSTQTVRALCTLAPVVRSRSSLWMGQRVLPDADGPGQYCFIRYDEADLPRKRRQRLVSDAPGTTTPSRQSTHKDDHEHRYLVSACLAQGE